MLSARHSGQLEAPGPVTTDHWPVLPSFHHLRIALTDAKYRQDMTVWSRDCIET